MRMFFLIVFVLASKHEKAFVTRRLTEALKHIDDMNLSILYVTNDYPKVSVSIDTVKIEIFICPNFKFKMI